jgi:hypothetical protein
LINKGVGLGYGPRPGYEEVKMKQRPKY